MKPNTRILDYTALVQDGVLTLDDVPQDIKKEVTKWVRYLAGIKDDDGMIKDTTVSVPEVAANPVPVTTDNTNTTTASNYQSKGGVVNDSKSTI